MELKCKTCRNPGTMFRSKTWMLEWLSSTFLQNKLLSVLMSLQEISFLITLIFFPSRQTLRKLTCRSLVVFIIIFILQTQQQLIDEPDLITVSLVQEPQPFASPPDRMIVIFQTSSVFSFVITTVGLNLLNPQHGALFVCVYVHKDTLRSGRNRLSRTQIYEVVQQADMVEIDSC